MLTRENHITTADYWPITRRTDKLFICPMFTKKDIPDFAYRHIYDIIGNNTHRLAQVVVYSKHIDSYNHPDIYDVDWIVTRVMFVLQSEGKQTGGFWTNRIVDKINLSDHPDRS